MENISNGINIDGVDLDDFAFEKFDNENLTEEVKKLIIDKEEMPMPSNQMAISSDESKVEKNSAVVQKDSASRNLEAIIAALPISDKDSLKDWQKAISVDLRSHLVGKLVKAIFPNPLPETIQDQRIKDLISYAKKVEKDLFEVAPDKEAYYHMLAEKIYKIQKELMEKKKQRREREQNQQNE